MADFPEDTLYNIYSRIPIKSLARFRCVCKQWREYINDPHLAKIHNVKEEPKPMHIAPIIYSKYSETVLNFLHINMEDTTAGIMQMTKDLSSRLILKRSSINGYCNGLIALVQKPYLHDIRPWLLHNIMDSAYSFVVINPLTKECHDLPQLKRQYRIIGQGLGFDHSTNTFKMVCVFYTNIENISAVVHVLGTESWREIHQVALYRIDGQAVYANGRLYWFARTSSWIIGSHLVWLDMKTEEFGVIDLPAKQEEGGSFTYKLIDINGEVSCVYKKYRPGCDVEVWILKHEEWMIHCVFDQSKSGYYGLDVLGCWNQDGDLLIKGFRFFVFRLKSGSFHKLLGPEDEAGEGEAEVQMYQSSLLSLRKWH